MMIPPAIQRAGKDQAQVHAATVKRSLAVLAERRRGKTLSEIADAMDVTPERVRQLERKGKLFDAQTNGKSPAKKAAAPAAVKPKAIAKPVAVKPAAKAAKPAVKAKPTAKAPPVKVAPKAAPKVVRLMPKKAAPKVTAPAAKGPAKGPAKKALPPRKLFKKKG